MHKILNIDDTKDTLLLFAARKQMVIHKITILHKKDATKRLHVVFVHTYKPTFF